VSSRIILENNEGRIGMGFDASEVGRDPDVERLLRSSYSPSMNYEVRRLQKMLRSIRIDPMPPSFQGTIRSTDSMQASILSCLTRSPTEMIRDTFRVSHVFPESMRRVLPGLSWNLTGLSNYPPMPSDVLKPFTLFGSPDLSRSIAQAFKAHGLDSPNSPAWRLRRVQSLRTSTLRSFLKATPTFGPIVVSPDYEDDAPFGYHPDLQGWLIPETATESGGAINVEELWTVVVAYTQGIAVDHRTKVLLSVIGTDGRSFLVQVAGTVVGGLILYWILHH
jgi:hypothetical protein